MNPTPEQILQARKDVKLSQQAAANLLQVTVGAWKNWENGRRKMRYSDWKLFDILTKTSDD